MKAILRLGAGAVVGLVLILAVAVTALTVLPARAATTDACLPYPVLVEQLADRFGEKVFFWGDTGQGVKLLVAASPNGTWTVFGLIEERRVACIMTFGKSWTGAAMPANGEEG